MEKKVFKSKKLGVDVLSIEERGEVYVLNTFPDISRYKSLTKRYEDGMLLTKRDALILERQIKRNNNLELV